jgi:hypothetical protein
MTTIITDERCRGFVDDQGREWRHNTRIRLTTEIITKPNGRTLVSHRKWCPSCDAARATIDAED